VEAERRGRAARRLVSGLDGGELVEVVFVGKVRRNLRKIGQNFCKFFQISANFSPKFLQTSANFSQNFRKFRPQRGELALWTVLALRTKTVQENTVKKNTAQPPSSQRRHSCGPLSLAAGWGAGARACVSPSASRPLSLGQHLFRRHLSGANCEWAPTTLCRRATSAPAAPSATCWPGCKPPARKASKLFAGQRGGKTFDDFRSSVQLDKDNNGNKRRPLYLHLDYNNNNLQVLEARRMQSGKWKMENAHCRFERATAAHSLRGRAQCFLAELPSCSRTSGRPFRPFLVALFQTASQRASLNKLVSKS